MWTIAACTMRCWHPLHHTTFKKHMAGKMWWVFIHFNHMRTQSIDKWHSIWSTVSKTKINIFRFNVHLFYSFPMNSGVLGFFILNKTTFTNVRSFEINWVRQYLTRFMGLTYIVNASVYRTKPFLTGLGNGKWSWFPILVSYIYCSDMSW